MLNIMGVNKKQVPTGEQILSAFAGLDDTQDLASWDAFSRISSDHLAHLSQTTSLTFECWCTLRAISREVNSFQFHMGMGEREEK